MSKDILMIPDQSGDVSFSVVGEQADTGLALLQRLYVIILSDNSEAYRGGTGFLCSSSQREQTRLQIPY